MLEKNAQILETDKYQQLLIVISQRYAFNENSHKPHTDSAPRWMTSSSSEAALALTQRPLIINKCAEDGRVH